MFYLKKTEVKNIIQYFVQNKEKLTQVVGNVSYFLLLFFPLTSKQCEGPMRNDVVSAGEAFF